MASAVDWEELASRRLHALVEQRLAVYWLEAEAVLAESDAYASDPHPHIQPHHISTARLRLLEEGVLLAEESVTRGGGRIRVLTPADQHRRSTAIEKAASRKRLLAARYLSWAQGGTTYPRGIIGPTGERVARRSLIQSGAMRLIHPDAGEVNELLGVHLGGAPLDSGGLLPTGDVSDPGPVVAVAVEVKSIRDWIYPTSKELFQVLHKAAMVQQFRPDRLVLPTLICRRAHYTTFRMAKDLGFFVVDLLVQYVSSDAVKDSTHLDEVRSGLGLEDLRWETETDPRLVRRLRNTLPEQAQTLATSWARTVTATETAAEMVQLIAALRHQHTPRFRAQLMEALRAAADRAGIHSGW